MMAASKLLQKHLILVHLAYNHTPAMTPFLLSFLKKLKENKKTSLPNGHLITGESPTISAKALNAEHFEQTKSSVSKVFNV